jgi:hypothetical protein
MTKITNANIQLETGQVITSDAHGNNFAILCPNCNQFPILFVALKNQKGSSINNPAVCKNCNSTYYIKSDLERDELSEVLIKKIS